MHIRGSTRKKVCNNKARGKNLLDDNTALNAEFGYQAQNMMFGDAKHVIDFGKEIFKIDSIHWTALQAIHGIVHSPKNLGIKYTWFGSGYLSNMYFRVIANKPRYRFDNGGDMSFG